MVAYACEKASVGWARVTTLERALFDYVTPPEPPERFAASFLTLRSSTLVATQSKPSH